MRNEQLIRQWRLLRRLEASHRGVTVGVIAKAERVHPRTVKRDVLALREVGFPVEEARVHGERRWRLGEGYARLLSFPVSTSELVALALARPQLRPIEDSDVARAMDAFIGRIEATLAPEARALLGQLRAVVTGDPPHGHYGDLPGDLLRAAAERRTVEIEYDSAWRRALTRREVDPYAVRVHNGTLYVAGHDHLRRAVRVFAVERIRRLRFSGARFADPHFDAEEFFSRPLGVVHEGRPYDVRLRFSPEAAFFVEERPWHPSQKAARLPDRSLEVSLRIDGLREVAWKVLGYGPRARALAPPELVALVASELRAAAALYQQS